MKEEVGNFCEQSISLSSNGHRQVWSEILTKWQLYCWSYNLNYKIQCTRLKLLFTIACVLKVYLIAIIWFYS